MKHNVLSKLAIVLLFVNAGCPKPVQNGSDTTPTGFIVTVWRSTIGTPNRGDGIDISTANANMKLAVGQDLRIEIQVIDQQSGVKNLRFVTREIIDGNQLVQGNLSWACQGRPPLTGVMQGATMVFSGPLGNPNLAAGFRASVKADPYAQATCQANNYNVFEGRIQVEATNGDGLTSRSGILFFEKP